MAPSVGLRPPVHLGRRFGRAWSHPVDARRARAVRLSARGRAVPRHRCV